MTAALLLSSCSRKVEYQYEAYATLYHNTFTVQETVGQFEIPVLINNATGSDVQVAVTVTEGSALEGVDYEIISPANAEFVTITILFLDLYLLS